jgi:hypothetical protein
VVRNKDSFGRFTYDLSSQNNDSFSERNEFEVKDSTTINKNKSIRSLKEYNKKYDKYFSS